jgi:hypothetical protein
MQSHREIVLRFKGNQACSLTPLNEAEEKLVDKLLEDVAVAKQKVLCG